MTTVKKKELVFTDMVKLAWHKGNVFDLLVAGLGFLEMVFAFFSLHTAWFFVWNFSGDPVWWTVLFLGGTTFIYGLRAWFGGALIEYMLEVNQTLVDLLNKQRSRWHSNG